LDRLGSQAFGYDRKFQFDFMPRLLRFSLLEVYLGESQVDTRQIRISLGGALVRTYSVSRPPLAAIGFCQALGDARRVGIKALHLLQTPLGHFQITLPSLVNVLRVLWRQLTQRPILFDGACEVIRAVVRFGQFDARQRFLRVELDRSLEFPDRL